MKQVMYILKPLQDDHETVILTRDGRLWGLTKMPNNWRGREVEEQEGGNGRIYLWIFNESRSIGQNLGEIISRSEKEVPDEYF
jgi:hypothetical protein